jgi:hypothetical protein
METFEIFKIKTFSHRQDHEFIKNGYKHEEQSLGYTIIIHMQKILRETQSYINIWKRLHQHNMEEFYNMEVLEMLWEEWRNSLPAASRATGCDFPLPLAFTHSLHLCSYSPPKFIQKPSLLKE